MALQGEDEAMSPLEYGLTLATLVALTVADTVLCTVNLYYYTDTYAQYFNQGTGAVYILVSIPIVLYNRARESRQRRERNSSQLQGLLGKGDGEKPRPPLWILIAIGALNGTGNFFNAIGSPHTRADTQSLLQILGLPIVLLLSWVWLAQRPSGVAVGGALLILLGTVVSAAPTLAPGLFTSCGETLMPACAESTSDGSDGSDGGGMKRYYWYSVVIYFGSTLFYSTEKVFEESTFHRYTIDIFYMFFWTLVTQVMLGWVYYPIQVFPAFGGLHLSEIPSVIWDGALCTIGITATHRPECEPHGHDLHIECPEASECAFKIPLLFFVYCAVDYSTYAMGLYVIQRGGANLMVLTTAIALPLQQMAFAMHFVLPGKLYQPVVYTDLIALVLCLAGFFVYHQYSREGALSMAKGSR